MSIKAGSSKLVVLAEQTAFLLHQQEEMLSFYKKEYAEFTALLEQHIEKAKQEGKQSELEDLMFIKNVIQDQATQLADEMNQDIKFLQEQLDGITKVQALNNPEKELEFEKMLLEDGHKLLPVEEFEREVLEEALSSKKSMNAMLNDFKNTLQESGGSTLARLLEAMVDESVKNGETPAPDENGEQVEYDMNELGEDVSIERDGCCGKNDLSAGEECCSTEGGIDIFSLLQQAADQSGKQESGQSPIDGIKGCCLEGDEQECTSDDESCKKRESEKQSTSCSSERTCQSKPADSSCCKEEKPSNGCCKDEKPADGCCKDTTESSCNSSSSSHCSRQNDGCCKTVSESNCKNQTNKCGCNC